VSKTMTIADVILLVMVLLLWAAMVSTVATPNVSDPAGNGLAQAFGAMYTVALWILLAILAIRVGLRGAMPMWALVAAFILVPASGAAALAAGDLLKDLKVLPVRWIVVVPIAAPLLIAGYSIWSIVPALRAALPANVAGAVVWGTVLVLSIAPWPLIPRRAAAVAEFNARWQMATAENRARFAAVRDDTPLWEWTPFLASGNEFEGAALERIHRLTRAQADAEIMLERGDFPLRMLRSMELEPTAALCEKALGMLARRTTALRLTATASQPYTKIAEEVEGGVDAMQWLAKNHCDCKAEAGALLTVASAYNQPGGWDMVCLRKLRDGE
jgi:hypothetical protein